MIQEAIIISLITLGLRSSTQKDKILGFVRGFFLSRRKKNIFINGQRHYREVQRFPMFIHKPIITCVECMASFWSIVLYNAYHYLTHTLYYDSVVYWLKLPAIIFIVTFTNGLLWKIYVALKLYIESHDDILN